VAYASSSDVGTRLGRELTTEEAELVNTRLADVERMIRKKIPDLAAKITAGTIDVEDVQQVEADAVLRLVRNPDGYRSESDGTYTYEFNTAMASGKLEILPEEWATLGLVRSRMTIIVPAFTPLPAPSVHPFMIGG
jgi:Phage protein Gp19/Gp15/Gp42